MPAPSAAVSVPISSAFAGALALAYSGLQLRVGLYRLESKILYGTSTAAAPPDETLVHISRAGANFAEYAPTGVFLLFLLEAQKLAPPAVLCSVGSVLLLSRLAHALALSRPDVPAFGKYVRPIAFLSTLGVLAGSGLYLWVTAYRK